MCSHIVGLLKQLIHYVIIIIKLQSVPADLMQQSWHKLRLTEIKAAPVMYVLFSKAKQSEAARRDPVLYKQEYNFEQQQYLKEGLLQDLPACAFANILATDTPTQYLAISFGFKEAGRVTALQFGDVLLCKSPPTELLIHTFCQYSTVFQLQSTK